MQQVLSANQQSFVLNQTRSKVDILTQLAENPILKDLLAGRGQFSPKKYIKIKKNKSPVKQHWDTSSALGIVGVSQSPVRANHTLEADQLNKKIQLDQKRKRQGSARPPMFDTLEPEMVPLVVKAENFGGIKGDIFEERQRKQKGLKKSPTAQSLRDEQRLQNVGDLAHIIRMPDG